MLTDIDEDASRPSTPVAKPPPTKDAAATPAPSRGSQRGRTGPASRGGRYYQRGGKASQTQDGAEEPAAEGEKKCKWPLCRVFVDLMIYLLLSHVPLVKFPVVNS